MTLIPKFQEFVFQWNEGFPGGSDGEESCLQCRSESESCSVVSNSLWPHELYCPWNSPCQNSGVGSCSLLQEIFPTQGSNPGLPHCRQILCQLSYQRSPRIREWEAYPFSSGSSRPRNRTGVSCIAGGFFTELLQLKDKNYQTEF